MRDEEPIMSTTTTPTKTRRALPPLMALSDAAADRLRSLYAKGQEGMLLRMIRGERIRPHRPLRPGHAAPAMVPV